MGNKIKKQIILSPSYDPAINLGYEEYLMLNQEPNVFTLFLYQNIHTIVIGQNQNPWKECNVELFNKYQGTIIRRLSGGGAVYHDKGNLNFSIITDRDNFSVENNLELIIGALAKLKLPVYYSGKNDLLIHGFKFSGNAFYEEGNNSCHHGTILVNSDLRTLGKYLTPSKLKLKSKAIKSVVARVANLIQFNKNITIDTVIESLIESLKESTNQRVIGKAMDLNTTDLKTIIAKYKSWEWTYQQSPAFEMTVEKKFDWGLVELNYSVKQGFIERLKFYTDSIQPTIFKLLNEKLINVEFNLGKMKSIIEEYASLSPQICRDLKQLISEIVEST